MGADDCAGEQADYARHFQAVWQLDETRSKVADVAEGEDQERLHHRRHRQEAHVLEDEREGDAEDEADADGNDTEQQELAEDLKRRVPVEAGSLQ